MSKLALLTIAAFVVGIFGGVIEVEFHFDKLSALPGKLVTVAADGALLEKGRVLVTRFKRAGEIWIIRAEEQRLKIATAYIEQDSQHLQDLITKNEPGENIMPAVELLMISLERASGVIEKTSADNVVAWQAETKAAYTKAATAVQRLKEIHEDNQVNEQKFAAIVTRLEGHISFAQERASGDVAGAKNESANSPASTIPAIQLNF